MSPFKVPVLAAVALALSLAAGTASAVLLEVDSGSGKLTGASGIIIGGQSYDVKFMDGTCEALFNGCDEAADFLFGTAASSEQAARALLDQVFLDGPLASTADDFDSRPELTLGCTSTEECAALMPYEAGGGGLAAKVAWNSRGASDDVLLAYGPSGYDLAGEPYHTWAVWSESPQPVPEPSALALACLGLLGLAIPRRRAVLVLAAAMATSAGAHAALVSVIGNGRPVPDTGSLAIVIPVSDTRLIRDSGNNITLSLLGIEHDALHQLSVTLEHVGSAAGVQTVFNQVLGTGTSGVRFDGDYAFNSGATLSLRQAVDPIIRSDDAVASGTYRPTLADDFTTSEMSSAWNGQSAYGYWRMFVADHAGNFATNANWAWRLDIEVEDAVAVPEPAMLPLLLVAAGSAGAWRRSRQCTGLAGRAGAKR